MSFFENPEHLRLLRDLLNPNTRNNDSDTDEDEPLARNNLTPASIGAQQDCAAAVEKRQKAAAAVAPAEQKVPKTIEEWQEIQEKEDAEILETRKRPEYTMTYRQAVGTEDIYLQMGNRTNSSASCEDLLVEIALPEETTPAHKMDLSIMEDEVDLATPIYRLKLPLVHKVDVDRCRAKYDAELRKLSLTLRLKRELDFVNF